MSLNKKIVSFISVLLVSILILGTVTVNATTFKSIKKNYDYHYGIDVSSHNGQLDLKKIKSQGIEFVYIRLGFYKEDGGHIDTRFEENVKECVENGVEFGVYIYSYVYKAADLEDCADWANEQLENLGNYCKDKDTIQVSYDIEGQAQMDAVNNGKISKKTLNKNIINFCNKIRDYGYVPVVYSYLTYFRNYLDLDAFQKNEFKIWYAQWPYTSSLNTTVKKRMYNNTYADVWQFSNLLTINGKVFDTNVCYKDFYDYSNEDSTLKAKGLKKTYEYTGSKIKPEFEIYDGSQLLVKNKDYKVFYYKNKKLGRAMIKIVRVDENGNYLETKTFRFIIKPARVNLSASVTDKSAKLSWKASHGASKYYVYKKTEDGYEKVDKTLSTSYKVKKLKEGKKYTFAVRAYGLVKNKGYYSGYSDIELYTKYKKVEIKKVTSDAEGTATVKWVPKESKTKGYQVKYATNKSFNNSKTVLVEQADIGKLKIENLKSDKKYYFKIRSYNIKEGEKLYSLYSDTINKTIK